MEELRKMTMGEIAEIADLPKETARARLKTALGGIKNSYGWARFDMPSTLRIAVHAEMMRRTGIGQIALRTADFVAGSYHNFAVTPPHTIRRKGQLEGSYLVFRQWAEGGDIWNGTWCPTQKEALNLAGAYIFDSSLCMEAAGFYFLNVSTVADWALDRIFDLQGIDGNEAKVPQ